MKQLACSVLQGEHGRAVAHLLCAEREMLQEPNLREDTARSTWNALGLSYTRLGEPEKASATKRVFLLLEDTKRNAQHQCQRPVL